MLRRIVLKRHTIARVGLNSATDDVLVSRNRVRYLRHDHAGVIERMLQSSPGFPGAV
jgi:hypothetical protein